MQVALTIKIERADDGGFVAYFPGDHHTGYGQTPDDAREAHAVEHGERMTTPTAEQAAPKPRGRPPLRPGAGKPARIELRTTQELAEKADALSQAAGISRNAWIEALIKGAKK